MISMFEPHPSQPIFLSLQNAILSMPGSVSLSMNKNSSDIKNAIMNIYKIGSLFKRNYFHRTTDNDSRFTREAN